ncbi:hypothetical protein C8R44DRAFT_878558 [Mycena epipterygia]|nr:hypothetical protein C8R44DRAFT_878558 [Mycena epipterygia]
MSVDSDNLELSSHASNHVNADDISSILSELSEDLDDIPTFETEHTLLNWVSIGKEKLKKLVGKPEPESKPSRGPYFKSKIGAVPAERTLRLKKAEERTAKKQHGEGFMGWFQQVSTASHGQAGNQAVNETADNQPTAFITSSPDDSGSEDSGCRRAATVKEVDDVSLSPLKISLQEEDGLANFEDIFLALDFDPPDISQIDGPSGAPPADPIPSLTSPSDAAGAEATEHHRPYIPGQSVPFS